ncbi:dual specificity protein phosphatase family protein [Haloarchaeobius salinus]|uniref:dual specificity protein phosphatase family protein n=1 Tax=Haloarchaeobius salinus TaxID=1198298 RepID=UPI00210E2E0C|nr:dual specificity protein phosphatase [Haloarchaeobius salinus]
MNEVVNGLFVGTLEDAGNSSLLDEQGISAIVSLTYTEPEDGFPQDKSVSRWPMMDGPQNSREQFEQAVAVVETHLEQDTEVLVHCSAGASRSPAVAATALAIHSNLELEEAFKRISSRRDAVEPHNALIQQAARVFSDTSI